MVIISCILFLLLNTLIFKYVSDMFSIKKVKIYNYLILFLVNYYIFYLYILSKISENVFLILLLIIIFIEIFYLFFKTNIRSFFISIFLVNIFYGIILTVRSIYAMIDNVQIIDIINSKTKNSYSLFISILICFIIILCIKISNIGMNELSFFYTSKQILKISSIIMIIVYCYYLYNTINIYKNDNYDLMNFYQLKIAACCLFCTFYIIVYSYFFSKFTLLERNYKKIEEKIESIKDEDEELINKATIDSLTSSFKRNYGINYLNDKLKTKKFGFCVSFVDLDGLKYVNDTFGHEEGDEYIKNVFNVLRNSCSGAMISRYGGDEILIVLDGYDEYRAYNTLEIAKKTVLNLKKFLNKNYDMSISYGIYEVTKKNDLDFNEIINFLDVKMYNNKLANKKLRK